MDDHTIISLYWNRDEAAIRATEEKYGSYCTSIAVNILKNDADAAECVNDTWLGTWNSIPPQRPNILSAFLGKITRNLALNRYEREHAAKRGGGEIPLILEELAECVSGEDDVERTLDSQELSRAISEFLAALPQKKRTIFIRRYWYSESIDAIAGRLNMRVSAIHMTLSRTRSALRQFLLERGFEL